MENLSGRGDDDKSIEREPTRGKTMYVIGLACAGSSLVALGLEHMLRPYSSMTPAPVKLALGIFLLTLAIVTTIKGAVADIQK